MKSILILHRLNVENANAISGIVYGFPAVTHFLGYVHALSRELQAKYNLELGACSIICHNHQVQAHKSGGFTDYVFSLTRNPLTKDGETAPFNEEGRINMEISLAIECDFTSYKFNFGGDTEEDERKLFCDVIHNLVMTKRLAGGNVTKISKVTFDHVPQIEEERKKLHKTIRNKLLPGFVLCDRSQVLENYLLMNPHLNPFEGLIDFVTLKTKAENSTNSEITESKSAKWEYLPKITKGWIVPIQTGYRAISPLYAAGEVRSARDTTVPFRFVEAMYTLGEWIGVHKIQDFKDVLWNYRNDEDLYICYNNINNIKETT